MFLPTQKKRLTQILFPLLLIKLTHYDFFFFYAGLFAAKFSNGDPFLRKLSR